MIPIRIVVAIVSAYMIIWYLLLEKSNETGKVLKLFIE